MLTRDLFAIANLLVLNAWWWLRLQLQSSALNKKVCCADSVGVRPVHLAVEVGHCDVVESLIEAGCNVNEPSYNGTTPLHVACEYGHLTIVSCFILQNIELCFNISGINYLMFFTVTVIVGAMENADWKLTDQIAGLEKRQDRAKSRLVRHMSVLMTMLMSTSLHYRLPNLSRLTGSSRTRSG